MKAATIINKLVRGYHVYYHFGSDLFVSMDVLDGILALWVFQRRAEGGLILIEKRLVDFEGGRWLFSQVDDIAKTLRYGGAVDLGRFSLYILFKD